jgi:Co/Zn/Cd efflux system component
VSPHAPAPIAATAAGAHQRRLVWVLGLTGSFLLVEVVAGRLTGSLALLADAGHMLTDVAALAVVAVVGLDDGGRSAL